MSTDLELWTNISKSETETFSEVISFAVFKLCNICLHMRLTKSNYLLHDMTFFELDWSGRWPIYFHYHIMRKVWPKSWWSEDILESWNFVNCSFMVDNLWIQLDPLLHRQCLIQYTRHLHNTFCIDLLPFDIHVIFRIQIQIRTT